MLIITIKLTTTIIYIAGKFFYYNNIHITMHRLNKQDTSVNNNYVFNNNINNYNNLYQMPYILSSNFTKNTGQDYNRMNYQYNNNNNVGIPLNINLYNNIYNPENIYFNNSNIDNNSNNKNNINNSKTYI